jgi:hypothetical protein
LPIGVFAVICSEFGAKSCLLVESSAGPGAGITRTKGSTTAAIVPASPGVIAPLVGA